MGLIHSISKFFTVSMDVPPSIASEKAREALKEIGNIDPTCPHCGAQFSSFPQRKTKCRSCGEFAYSRTRPIDGRKVLLREAELGTLDEQWSIASGSHDAFLREQERQRLVRADLARELKREPLEHEFQWRILEIEADASARDGNWGLYRNARFSMGETLRKQGELREALSLYFEVCYMDLSGPQNNGGLQAMSVSAAEYPPFDPAHAILAPGVLSRCVKAASRLELGRDEVRDAYFSAANRVNQLLQLPVDAVTAWQTLEPELFPP